MVSVWQMEQAARCPSCGIFDFEQEEDPEAWVPGIHLCVVCASVEKFREQISEERRNLPSEGFKVRLYRGSDNGD